MILNALRAELVTGPLAEALTSLIAAGDDEAIAEQINAPCATTSGAISRSQFAIWAAQTGMRAVIRDHANNPSSPLRSIAITLEDFLAGASDSLDFSKPQNQAMLAAWVASGGCTQEQADDLLTQSAHPVSRAQQVFGCSVTPLDIRRALLPGVPIASLNQVAGLLEGPTSPKSDVETAARLRALAAMIRSSSAAAEQQRNEERARARAAEAEQKRRIEAMLDAHIAPDGQEAA